MTGYAALLRAINLGSHQKVAMADLRAFASALGLVDAKTLLQSGNMVFQSVGKSPAQLETLLESESKKRLGLETPYFVRSAADWRKLIDANPFPEAAATDPSHLVVMFCRDALAAAAVKKLQASIVGREQVRAVGREAYITYPDGVGESKLSITVIERALGTKCTGRNWNTVNRISNALG